MSDRLKDSGLQESGSGKASTLLARIIGRVAPVEPHESAAAIASFVLFFCILGGYFAVRPVRETIGTLLGRDQVADLFVVTWIASLALIPLYGAVVAKFRRSTFLPVTYGFVALALVLIGLSLRIDEANAAVGQFFYVFISVLNLFLVSVFWSFMLELFDSGQAKRLFGVIAAGGSAGALVGPFIADMAVSAVGNSGILFLGAALFVAAIFCQRVLLNIWAAQRAAQSLLGAAQDRALGGNPFAGFTLLLRSPYLLGIALFVVLLATVNTLLYFEQMRLVQETFVDSVERTRVFARLDWIVQTLTILSQVLLTGRIASRFGIVALLTLVPLAMVFGFLGLAASGTFAVLAVVFVMRRACEYAFVRPAREMLFSTLDKETKYKAKNVIDVPVYRGADALAAQINNVVVTAGAGTATVALFGAVVAALWGVVGWSLGRRSAAEPQAQTQVVGFMAEESKA